MRWYWYLAAEKRKKKILCAKSQEGLSKKKKKKGGAYSQNYHMGLIRHRVDMPGKTLLSEEKATNVGKKGKLGSHSNVKESASLN